MNLELFKDDRCREDDCTDCRLQKYQAMCETYINEQYELKQWVFKFSKHKTAAGMCYYDQKLIVLSEYFVLNNSDEEIINTMLHEIAHALAPRWEGHGKVWRKIFKDLLIKYNQPVNVTRCYDNNVNMPTGKYKITCTCCGDYWTQHKKTSKIKRAFQHDGYMIGRWHKACGMASRDKLLVTIVN